MHAMDPRQESEKLIKKLLTKKEKHEARQWLSGAPRGITRFIGEMDPDASAGYIRNLYDLGAEEILVVEISESPNRKLESADTLILKLPNKPSMRAAIFEAESTRVTQMGLDPETDYEQDHLLIWFD
jgi:hypothetical protein